jgi:hypothetical protein
MLLTNAGEAMIHDLIFLRSLISSIRRKTLRMFKYWSSSPASRPELEIKKKPPEIQHYNLMLDRPDDLANTRRDISIFLEAKLHEVANEQEPLVGSDWPGHDRMQKLLGKAGHLFIYAATLGKKTWCQPARFYALLGICMYVCTPPRMDII